MNCIIICNWTWFLSWSFSRPFSLPGHPSPADYFHLSPSLYVPFSTHFLFYLSSLFMFPSLPYFPLPTHISKLTSLSIPDILPLLQWIIFFHHFPFPPTQRLQSCDSSFSMQPAGGAGVPVVGGVTTRWHYRAVPLGCWRLWEAGPLSLSLRLVNTSLI